MLGLGFERERAVLRLREPVPPRVDLGRVVRLRLVVVFLLVIAQMFLRGIITWKQAVGRKRGLKHE